MTSQINLPSDVPIRISAHRFSVVVKQANVCKSASPRRSLPIIQTWHQNSCLRHVDILSRSFPKQIFRDGSNNGLHDQGKALRATWSRYKGESRLAISRLLLTCVRYTLVHPEHCQTVVGCPMTRCTGILTLKDNEEWCYSRVVQETNEEQAQNELMQSLCTRSVT